MELALDTATNTAAVALSESGKVIGEITWLTAHNHTVELIPAIISLLDRHEVSIHDINAIIAANGPGSFNGLRVALATAKGLAFALGIPLVTISTLEIAALAHSAPGSPVCAIARTGREEIAAAIFQSREGELQRLVAEHMTTIDLLCASIEYPTVFCGETASEALANIAQLLGEKALLPEKKGSDAVSSISCLCQLGWRRIEKGDLDDVRTAEPLYLKRPAITLPKRRAHDAMSSVWPGCE